MGIPVLELVQQQPPEAEIPALYAVPEYTEFPAPAPEVASDLSIPEQLGVMVVAEMASDKFDRMRANRLIDSAKQMGSILMRTEVQLDSESTSEQSVQNVYPTLKHAINAAANGDKKARKVVEANTRTEAYEITFKSGHVSEARIEIGPNGLSQYGQSMTDVYINSVRFASKSPEIYRRTVPEVRNGMRIESLQRQGLLKDNYLVVFSRYGDGWSDDQGRSFGLFPDTKSCSIQAITETSPTELCQQSAFVAGVKEKGAERHDAETVTAVGRMLNVDFGGKSDYETIDMAILVPKRIMPNGVTDVVKMYDQAAGGTFFGESKPVENYEAYVEKCRRREEGLSSTVEIALERLIAESINIATPKQATDRLHKIVEEELAERSKMDRTINPNVFGAVAAAHIENSRNLYDAGDIEGADKAMAQAKRTAKSGSCARSSEDSSDDSNDSTTENDSSDSADEEDSGKRWMTCPFCKSKVFEDPCASRIKCSDCTAEVVNGQVKSEGDGGKKARAKRAAEMKAIEIKAERKILKTADNLPQVA